MKHILILISILFLSSFLTSCEKKDEKEEKRDLSKFYNLYYWEKDYLPKPDGRGVIYTGIRNGQSGHYKEKWEGEESEDNKDLGKYEGDLVDGFPIGHGTLTFPDGSKYVGELRHGFMDGQGTTTLTDGSKLVGEWRMGRILNVTVYNKNGDIISNLVNGEVVSKP